MNINKITRFCEILEQPAKDCGIRILPFTLTMLNEEYQETYDAIALNDVAEVLDGFGDIAFLAINGIYKQFRLLGQDPKTATLSTKDVMNRITAANLNKLQVDGTVLRNAVGKIQKPEGWKEPQYEDLI